MKLLGCKSLLRSRGGTTSRQWIGRVKTELGILHPSRRALSLGRRGDCPISSPRCGRGLDTLQQFASNQLCHAFHQTDLHSSPPYQCPDRETEMCCRGRRSSLCRRRLAGFGNHYGGRTILSLLSRTWFADEWKNIGFRQESSVPHWLGAER